MVNHHDGIAETTAGPQTRTPARRLTILLAFAWIAFLLHSETGVSLWLHDNLAVPLNNLTGWQLRLVSAHMDIKTVHLVFALALVTLSYPLFKNSPRVVVPLYDWVLIIVTVCAAAYLIAFRYDIETRIGLLLRTDLIAGVAGLIVMCLALFRAIGAPMFLITGGFLAYACLNGSSFAPDTPFWNVDATNRALRAYWLEAEGVFGRMLEVAVALVFPIVLLGSLLDKAGARVYFTQLGAAWCGHMRGGAGKATVAASILSGIYAPSSRANTAGCAPLTVPLMEHNRYPRQSAGMIQQAASAHAQLVPPVMAAAVFLIADRAGADITEIALHLIASATMSVVALFAFVHIDALKKNLPGLARQPDARNGLSAWARGVGWLAGLAAVILAANHTHGWIATEAPHAVGAVAAAAFLLVYLVAVWAASRRPDLEPGDPHMPVAELAPAGMVAPAGLYLLLPLIVVIWSVMTAEAAEAASFYAAVLVAAMIVATHHPLKALFRGQFDYAMTAAGRGMKALTAAIVTAARLMAAVVIASAGAGIIVSSAGILGFEPVLGALLERLGTINFGLGLAGAAIVCAAFGAGMPTAIGYLLAAVLVAPSLVSMCLAAGFQASLLSVHLFVLFFAVAASHPAPSPAKLGLVFPPFFFFFNPDLLLIDVALVRVPVVIAMSALGAVFFVAACHRHFIVRSRLWETVVLAGVAFTLLHPGFWLDRLQSPFREVASARIFAIASTLPEGRRLNITVAGPARGAPQEQEPHTVTVAWGAANRCARLEAAGLTVFLDGERAILQAPFPGTPFVGLNAQFEFSANRPVEVTGIKLPVEGRWPKDLFYLPALGLALLVYLLQRRRRQT